MRIAALNASYAATALPNEPVRNGRAVPAIDAMRIAALNAP